MHTWPYWVYGYWIILHIVLLFKSKSLVCLSWESVACTNIIHTYIHTCHCEITIRMPYILCGKIFEGKLSCLDRKNGYSWENVHDSILVDLYCPSMRPQFLGRDSWLRGIPQKPQKFSPRKFYCTVRSYFWVFIMIGSWQHCHAKSISTLLQSWFTIYSLLAPKNADTTIISSHKILKI